MKRFVNFTLILIAIITMVSCGGDKQQGNKFTGSFTDEFDNKFTLNEDYSATIQFVGEDSLIKTTWSDGDNHDRAYATIKFNGDPTYFFLRDGKLYRHLEEMQQGRCAINIKYNE